MVDYNNPEEEKKGGESTTQITTFKSLGQKEAPTKSVGEICQVMADCTKDAAVHNIDFLNYLCDAAMNLDASSIKVEVDAMTLFTSDSFQELVSVVNAWKEINAATGSPLSDYLLTFEASYRDKVAATFLQIWPYLHVVYEDLQ